MKPPEYFRAAVAAVCRVQVAAVRPVVAVARPVVAAVRPVAVVAHPVVVVAHPVAVAVRPVVVVAVRPVVVGRPLIECYRNLIRRFGTWFQNHPPCKDSWRKWNAMVGRSDAVRPGLVR